MTTVRLDEFLVDGQGERGLCFGDSGAPLIGVLPGQGPVVLGIESWGSSTCRGIEHIVRLDRAQEWVRTIERMNDLPGPECADDGVSYCWGQSLVSCVDGGRIVTDCGEESARCGWGHQEGHLACTDAPSCEGLDDQGRCVSQSEILRCPLGIPHVEVCFEGFQCQPSNDDVGCEPLNRSGEPQEHADGESLLRDGGLDDPSIEDQPMMMDTDDDEGSDLG